MVIPIIVLFIVFALIAVRKIGNVKLQIWQIMLFGAIIVLLTGQISPMDAFASINLDVILFLFGMFVVGQALEESGYLSHLSYRFFRRAKSVDQALLLILFGMGLLSAFLMNDTLAIIGTPVVLLLAKKNSLPPKILLLTLAFSITIGSVMSPIGNPQNLLIAINGNLSNPFATFFRYLFLPTIVNLLVAFVLLKLLNNGQLKNNSLNHSEESIKDAGLARICRVSLALIVVLVILKIATVTLNLDFDFRLTYIALVAALPILVFSTKRFTVIKHIDWYTLVFFASMFVLMQSVWISGFFQFLLSSFNTDIVSVSVILAISVVLSQFISNVPLVALFLPLLVQAGVATKEMMALAAGSTIAGNLLILGAASNVIIIQNAERRSGETLTFLEFTKIGIPLTAINVFVYWLFLQIP
jgi:Na+/H+ antiporter NhaD/arsenite permease-like protein